MKLETRKGQKLELSNGVMTGETFPIKDYIKTYLDGKWDAAAKGWRVDEAKLTKLLVDGSSIGLHADDSQMATATAQHGNGWCNKCHSYCYGDCEAH